MKIETFIVESIEQLNRAIDMKAKPEWIIYRSGILYEILCSVDLKLDNIDELKLHLTNLFNEYTLKLNN